MCPTVACSVACGEWSVACDVQRHGPTVRRHPGVTVPGVVWQWRVACGPVVCGPPGGVWRVPALSVSRVACCVRVQRVAQCGRHGVFCGAWRVAVHVVAVVRG